MSRATEQPHPGNPQNGSGDGGEDLSIKRVLKRQFIDALSARNYFSTLLFALIVPALAILGVHRTLEAMTEDLASIDPHWYRAATPLVIILGLVSFTLARHWPHRRKKRQQGGGEIKAAYAQQQTITADGITTETITVEAVAPATALARPAAPHRARWWQNKHVLALVAGVVAVCVLALYLMLYQHCVVHLQESERAILRINSEADPKLARAEAQADEEAPSSHSAAKKEEASKEPPFNLVLPLSLPAEIKDYNDNLVRQCAGVAISTHQNRAGIGEILAQNPQWLYDMLENNYSTSVAGTKATLLLVYAMIFILFGLTSGWAYDPVESLVGLVVPGARASGASQT